MNDHRACRGAPHKCLIVLSLLTFAVPAQAADSQPPTVPGHLQTTLVTPRQISLSWTKSIDDAAGE